jgi:hypothetical protein
METFTKLFGSLLLFVYHCFDRIVINGYLSNLSRPEQVVYFFRQVLGIPVVSKEVLSRRTNDYRTWVEAFARNHRLPIEWAEKGARKEDQVLPALRGMEKKNSFGVYFIFRSMEQGRTFRISVPKFPTNDPNHRILAHQRSRFTHYYFYIRDEVLGPIIVRMASFFPFHATYYPAPGESGQVTYPLTSRPFGLRRWVRPLLHGTGTGTRQSWLQERRQRFPRRGRRGRPAGRRRPTQPRHYPQAA